MSSTDLHDDGSGAASIPEWARDLVIYEISTRNFATGDEPESGTFSTVAERLPYLAELGINGIWLSGHNWAHDSHFYNIWTQYATYRPDRLDPRLGGAEELRALVEKAHEQRIRVFLDCITHGVMTESSLVAEHPEWFAGGSWGMTDYDWFGDHPDLDRFWVETWVEYVRDFGIDGFRLDVAMYRPDLWAEIKRRAGELGREIVVFHEHGPGAPGAVDFLQRDIVLKENTEELDTENLVGEKEKLRDIYRAVEGVLGPAQLEFCVLATTASGVQYGTDRGSHALRIERAEREIEAGPGYKRYWIVLDVSGLPEVPEELVVDGAGHRWALGDRVHVDSAITLEEGPNGAPPGEGPRWRLRFLDKRAPGELVSIQLSSHDTGWEGYPRGSNPYAAQGSRCLMGYASLLAPAIPIFMAGEEFAADFVPNPRLTPGLFGDGEPGTGTWLYGSWLQWRQLEKRYHAEMWEDVRALLALRREYADLIRPLVRGEEVSYVHRLEEYAPASLPVPYAYTQRGRALVVAGNPTRDVQRVRIELPAAICPALSAGEGWAIRSLWGEATCEAHRGTLSDRGTTPLEIEIPADRKRGGGLAVLEVTPNEEES